MTDELPRIRRFKILGAYRLRLWFSDGTAGNWDFHGLAAEEGPMVEAFRDPAFFDRVFLEMGALTWPNGFDWSPEALHADMAEAGVLRREHAPAAS